MNSANIVKDLYLRSDTSNIYVESYSVQYIPDALVIFKNVRYNFHYYVTYNKQVFCKIKL